MKFIELSNMSDDRTFVVNASQIVSFRKIAGGTMITFKDDYGCKVNEDYEDLREILCGV